MDDKRSRIRVVVVDPLKAQEVRGIAESMGIFHKEFGLQKMGDGKLGIPILDGVDPTFKIENSLSPCQIADILVPRRRSKSNASTKLKESCGKILGQDAAGVENEVPTKWEIHGDVAIFNQTSFASPIWKAKGPEVWPVVCKILNVDRLAKKSNISNDNFRSPRVELLHGFQEDDTWVTRTENGIRYTWDVTRSMFSVGNVTEKARLSKLSLNGQVVVDLFSGIGYFTLSFLVRAKAKHVHCCEWNPRAVEALKKNLQLNKIPEERVTIHEGDNRVHCPRNVADVVNLGLIPSSASSYRVAVDALKRDKGGLLLVHGNCRTLRSDDALPLEDVLRAKSDGRVKFVTSREIEQLKNSSWRKWCLRTVEEVADKLSPLQNWTVQLSHLERVKPFAPHVDHLVLDLRITPGSIVM